MDGRTLKPGRRGLGVQASGRANDPEDHVFRASSLFSCHFWKRQIALFGRCLELNHPGAKKERPAVSQIGGPPETYARQRSRTSVNLRLREQPAPRPWGSLHLPRRCLPLAIPAGGSQTFRPDLRVLLRPGNCRDGHVGRPMKSAVRARGRQTRRQRGPSAPGIRASTLSPLTARRIPSPVPRADRAHHRPAAVSNQWGFQSFPGLPRPLVVTPDRALLPFARSTAIPHGAMWL
jgi:hypothetical protein